MKIFAVTYYIFIGLICLSLLGFSCSYQKAVVTEQNAVRYSVTDTADQILFLNFKARKSALVESGETIELVSRQMVPGMLKSKIKTANLALSGELIFSFLTQKDIVVAIEIIEDNLTAPVEYSEEDGVLKRVIVEKTEADLFLRLQYNPQFYRVKISKVDTTGALVFISDIRL